ncbi:MAG: DUF3501 family protein [Acidobacteriaceae bacterium]|jgi:hypothetical protein
MRPIELSEIASIADYELERRTLRPRMVALKDRRRIRVGDHLTFLFENRETVRYQIQEMMRIERIVDLAAIRHEVETYNELIPPPGGLAACLLIEYAAAEERDEKLRELLGLDDHVFIAVAGLPPSKAVFDARQIASARLSAVQYIRFDLTPEQRARWREGVRIVVDNPNYRAETALTPDRVAELEGDFE